MSQSKFNIFKEKYKHLSSIQIEYIINTLSKHYDFHKGKIRNTGRTALVKSLAIEVGTSTSNIYTILSDAKIDLMKSDLTLVNTLSPETAFARRNRKCKQSNISKLVKAKPFINMVIKEVKAKKLSSIDEVIHDLILNRHNEIDGLITVCTKTFYNYVHQEKIKLIPLDLPRMCSRRIRFKKTYISKAQKGTSITERPFAPKDRSEFGHWEGDLIVGGREGGRGALLTLLERKTRMYYMIPISDKTAKQVYMKVNRLEKQFKLTFPKIFKSITFDNGSEFVRHKDIEKNQLQKKNVLVFILVDHIDHVIVPAMRIVMDLFAILSLKNMQLIPFKSNDSKLQQSDQ